MTTERGGAARIVVATSVLRELSGTLSITESRLNAGTSVPGCSFAGFPKTQESFGKLHQRWDERRADLGEAMHAASIAAKAIAEAFEEVEAMLVSELEAGST